MSRDPKCREKWMAMLSKLCSPADPVTAVAALVAMLPLLTDFPDAAFTDRSLGAIAEKAKRLPSYAELRGWIAEWWKDNRPSSAAMLADNATGLTPYDRSWLAHYHRREAQGFAAPREADGSLSLPHLGTDPERIRAHTMSMIRQYAPRAAALVVEGVGR